MPLRCQGRTFDAAGVPALPEYRPCAVNTNTCVSATLSLGHVTLHETVAGVGNVRTWVTSGLEHDGLRMAGEEVLGRLIDMAAGRS